jgi:hypothetical protein
MRSGVVEAAGGDIHVETVLGEPSRASRRAVRPPTSSTATTGPNGTQHRHSHRRRRQGRFESHDTTQFLPTASTPVTRETRRHYEQHPPVDAPPEYSPAKFVSRLRRTHRTNGGCQFPSVRTVYERASFEETVEWCDLSISESIPALARDQLRQSVSGMSAKSCLFRCYRS